MHFRGIFKITQIFERWDDANKMEIRQLDNGELFLKLLNIFGAKKLETRSTTKKRENFKNGKVRFCLKADSWLNAIKTKLAFAKARLNFQQQEHNNCNRQCSPYGIPFHNWLKNNHITVDITYYLGSLLVSGGFCEF